MIGKVFKRNLIWMIFILLFPISVRAEMSFSEFSQAKNHLTRYGEFIGYMDGCAARPTFDPDRKSVLKIEDLVTPDEMHSIIIKSLEELDISFSTMEKLDNIIRESRNNRSQKVKNQINRVAASSYLETCLTIAISAQQVRLIAETIAEKNKFQSVAERTELFSALSPLR